MDKSLVGEGAVGKDVYEQYLETLGGLKLPYDEVFENLKHKISHINSCSKLLCVNLILWMGEF